MITHRRMVAVTISILAIFAISWRAVRSAEAAENAKEEMMKVEEERNQALQTGDVATLDRIYSDDLVYSNVSGKLLTKAQHLADLKGKTLHFISFAHEDVQATMHGDSGVVTGISKSVVEYQGEVSHAQRRFLNVFAKRDGRWQVVAHFELNIPDKQ
jgi:ketosteroid isomerase-like protein